MRILSSLQSLPPGYSAGDSGDRVGEDSLLLEKKLLEVADTVPVVVKRPPQEMVNHAVVTTLRPW